MKTAVFLVCLVFIIFTRLNAQIPVNGFVKNPDGVPLGWVNIIALGTTKGAMSDENGYFSFVADSSDRIHLKASLVGYAPVEKILKPGKGKTTRLEIILQEEDIRLSDIVVTASSWSSETVGSLPISPMEIVRTPGGAADIFQMLKTLPGLTPATENADLRIRGGEPGEALIMVDETPFRSPFKYESANGGLFSQLPAGMTDGIWFSSGGFPAKYGNALSGVLDISTRNEPYGNGLTAGWNMAGAMLDGSISTSNGRSGWNFGVSRDDTNPMMAANQQSNRFITAPVSLTAMGGYVTRIGETGRFKVTGLTGNDRQSVTIDFPERPQIYNGHTKSHRLIVSGSGELLSGFFISTAASWGMSEKMWELGIMNLTGKEPETSLRLDAEWILPQNQKFLAGGELIAWNGDWFGQIPLYADQPPVSGPFESYSLQYSHRRFGFYVEWEQGGLLLNRALSTRIGIRTDGGSDRKWQTVDPRIQVSFPVGNGVTVSGAAGVYSQATVLKSDYGVNEYLDLPAMQSIHIILSLVKMEGNGSSFRFEVYNKQLSNLPELTDNRYLATGFGWARGADLIYEGDFGYQIHGRVSYGYLDSKRQWKSNRYLASTDADITHSVTWVGRFLLTPAIELGWTMKAASGRPYTPVISAIPDSGGSFIYPVYGGENSSRLPAYFRLDSRITWMGTVFNQFFGVCYAEILNVLDTRNIMDYNYSSDYSEKKGVVSYFGRRTVVAGFQLTW